MLAEDKDMVRDTESGLKFDIRPVFSIKCNKDNEDDVKEWLNDKYGDLGEFTKEALVKKFIVKRIRKDIDADELDELDVPEFVGLKNRPDVWCHGWSAFQSQRSKEEV